MWQMGHAKGAKKEQKGERQRARREQKGGRGGRGREKQGGKCEGEQLEYFHSAAKLMNMPVPRGGGVGGWGSLLILRKAAPCGHFKRQNLFFVFVVYTLVASLIARSCPV